MKRSPSLHAQTTSTSPASETDDPKTLATGYTSVGICESPSSLCGSATIAEVGGGATTTPGGGHITNPAERFNGGFPVPDIEPVDGWAMFSIEVEDSDGFWTHEYFARGPVRDVHLDTSRFRFTPSQDRFAWLVRHGFPPRTIALAGWDDTEIESRIASERRAA